MESLIGVRLETLTVDGNDLVVRLSALEKIGAAGQHTRPVGLRPRAVRVSAVPGPNYAGIRAPGTGLPGVISLCSAGVLVSTTSPPYGRRPALVVEMTGASFDRLIVSCAGAAEAAARAADITRTYGLAHARAEAHRLARSRGVPPTAHTHHSLLLVRASSSCSVVPERIAAAHLVNRMLGPL
jgi:hypothetical protein